MNIEPGENTIDMRDVIERLEELTAKRDRCTVRTLPLGDNYGVENLADNEWLDEGETEARVFLDEFTEDEEDERRPLERLREDVDSATGGNANNRGLVLDSFFPQYAQQTAEDLGDIGRDSWLSDFVDWDRAAATMQQDWKQIEYGDYTYWVRS